MNDTEAESKEVPPSSWLGRLRHFFGGAGISDREDLQTLLRRAGSDGILDAEAQSIIEGALQVADMHVRDIMIPRTQVVYVKVEDDADDILPIVISAQHSRFPVIGDSLDEVIGILLAKDLLPLAQDKENRRFNIKDVMRPATFVPESKRLNVLLKEFRENRNHMAIVIDEFGDLAGVVTIEDVLEQIVGEIEDEHDIDDEAFIKEHASGQHSVKALMPLEEFNIHFGTKLPEAEFDTIGGYLLSRFGRIPQRDEEIRLQGLNFKILSADNRQVKLLEVTIPKLEISEGKAL